MHIQPLYLATTLLAAASTAAASPLPSKNQGLETREAASGALPIRSSDIEIHPRNLSKHLHLTVSDIEGDQGAQRHHDSGIESKILPLSSSS